MKKGFEYSYYIKDHLGSTRVVLSQTGKTLQQNSYYPFGMLMAGIPLSDDHNTVKYLYNGKELQDDFDLDWYDYGARFYDAALGRWFVVDPMANKRTWVSTYNYAQNNPISRFDPDGALDDGYQDMQGNYKWFNDEKEKIIQKEGKIWLHVSDDKNIYEMSKAGILDNIPEQDDPGEIKNGIDNLTTFEMWLDSPFENIGEGFKKGALNILYSLVNAPYSLLTGKSIGGTSLTSPEKVDAFVDFAPGLLTGGLTKTGQVVKTTKKGLQGFNQFVKRTSGITTTKGLPAGMKWQQRAGKLFQTNKVNQQGLKSFDIGLKATTVGTKIKKEIEK